MRVFLAGLAAHQVSAILPQRAQNAADGAASRAHAQGVVGCVGFVSGRDADTDFRNDDIVPPMERRRSTYPISAAVGQEKSECLFWAWPAVRKHQALPDLVSSHRTISRPLSD